MGTTIAYGLIPSYFTTYKNVATNVITTSLPLSIMVSAPMTQLLIDIYGWRGAMLLLSALNLHYIAAAAVLEPLKQCQTVNHGISYERLQNKESDIKGAGSENIYSHLKSLLNLPIFKNGPFLIVLFVCLISAYSVNGWIVYLVSIVQSKGLTAYDAANVATISGVGAFLIRIVLAFVQGKATYYKQLFFIGSILVMISYGGMYIANSFWLISLFSLTLGIGFSIQSSQMYNAVYATVEKDDAVGAVAWLNVAFGVGYIASGYISGKLQADFSSYQNRNSSLVEFSNSRATVE